MSDKTELKRLRVSHYGPLSEIDLDFDSGINAFYGKNESGKTLLVEAVTKMLIDDIKQFEGIDRVSQQPSGLLTVDKSGEEIEASQESLNKIFDNISPSDIRNAFIIRDFDLRLPERDNDFGNGNYFKDVTDRILGSKTNKIQALRNEIAEIGYLTNNTSEAILENRKDTGKLRDKKEDAEKLAEKIEEFLQKVEKEGLFQKYSEIDELSKKMDEKQTEINELENAKKQQKYRNGQELLEDLREAKEEIKSLEREKSDLEDLKEIRRRAKNFEKEAEKPGILKSAAAGSSALSALSLAGAILNPTPVFLAAAVIFLISAAVSVYKYRSSSKEVQKEQKKEQEIIKDAQAKGVEAETVPEVINAVDSYEEKLQEEEKELNEKRSQTVGELKGLFNSSAETPEKWTRELDNFSNTFESVNRSFEEGDLQEAEEELEEIKKKRKNLEEEIQEYNKLLEEFQSSISNLPFQKFIEEEPVNIESVHDLQKASRQLNRFAQKLEKDVKASRNAIEVLEEMEEEEEDEFNKIFREDSYAVEMFNKATEENYTDIRYDKKSQKLEVERKDGKIIDPENLSQGTYDLLYMSVRLKLAREILGQPGFLIMDNAFVHSDIDRVGKEIEFLKALEDEGWQVIYFTFRDDVKQKFEDITDVRELEGLEFAEK